MALNTRQNGEDRTENLRYGVIMAGGYGERLWPLSRSQRPKQLLRLLDDKDSLIGASIRRISPLIPPQNLYVITNDSLKEIIREGVPEIPDGNVMSEPHKRNTSACLAFAAAKLMAIHPGCENDITMAVLTADHKIGDDKEFRQTVANAMAIAEAQETLVILGIPPTRPETAFGYVEVGANDADENSPLHAFRVKRFRGETQSAGG